MCRWRCRAAGKTPRVRSTAACLRSPRFPSPASLAARGGVWFDCGGLQVHLGVEDDFRPAKKAHVAFVVDDLAAIAQALARAGRAVVRDVEQVEGSVRLFTDDPFGNRVELMQRAAAPAG